MGPRRDCMPGYHGNGGPYRRVGKWMGRVAYRASERTLRARITPDGRRYAPSVGPLTRVLYIADVSHCVGRKTGISRFSSERWRKRPSTPKFCLRDAELRKVPRNGCFVRGWPRRFVSALVGRRDVGAGAFLEKHRQERADEMNLGGLQC